MTGWENMDLIKKSLVSILKKGSQFFNFMDTFFSFLVSRLGFSVKRKIAILKNDYYPSTTSN